MRPLPTLQLLVLALLLLLLLVLVLLLLLLLLLLAVHVPVLMLVVMPVLLLFLLPPASRLTLLPPPGMDWATAGFELSWLDSDGDAHRLTSQAEWAEAVAVGREEGRPLLRLRLSV